jgi:hypothetical protein
VYDIRPAVLPGRPYPDLYTDFDQAKLSFAPKVSQIVL